jgi:hypothetical protein
VLKEVLKTNYRAVSDSNLPDGPLKCTQTPACVARAAAAAGADEVVFIKAVRPSVEQGANAYANLTLTVFSSDGAALLSFEQTVTNTTGVVDLRSLIVRAFTPALYLGRLQLRGVVDGDEVLIDGLRLDQRNEVALRAGPHRARVRHCAVAIAGSAAPVVAGVVVDIPFVVPFEGVVAVDVPPAGTESSSVIPANLPVWAHGATSVVLLGTIVGLGVREIGWRESADLLERGTCQNRNADETRNGFANLGTNPLGVCGGVQSETHQWTQLNRDLHFSLGIGMTALAAASTTALAVTLLRPSEIAE